MKNNSFRTMQLVAKVQANNHLVVVGRNVCKVKKSFK